VPGSAMTPAERQRRYRDRKKRGVCFVTVEVEPETIDALATKGHLCEWDENDPQAIAEALLAAANE
jgi:hypothetical protein